MAYTNYAQTFKTLEINFLPQVTYLGNFMKHSFIFGRLILEGILIMNFRKRYVKCETHFFLAYFSEQNWQFETNQVFITHNSILRWITKFPDSNNLAQLVLACGTQWDKNRRGRQVKYSFSKNIEIFFFVNVENCSSLSLIPLCQIHWIGEILNTKGQLISKRFFGVVDFLQKTNENKFT